MNTLKIKTTVSEEKEVNINLPVFWKEPANYEGQTTAQYLGVIDENNCINLFTAPDYVSVLSCKADRRNNEISKANLGWEKISEEEFLQTYRRILSSLSLEPSLINEDDPKDVL